MEAYSQLPWVTRLVKPRQCTGFMANTPLKLFWQIGKEPLPQEEYDRLRKKYTCKNRAYWKFKGLKAGGPRSMWRSDHSGTYCWSHLVSRGVFGDMDEEDRTIKWFKRHDTEVYEILTRVYTPPEV